MCVTAPRSFPFNETSCVIKHHLKTKSNPSSNTTKPADSISMSKQSDKKALKEKHDKKIVGKNYYKEVLGLDPKSEKKGFNFGRCILFYLLQSGGIRKYYKI